MKNQTPVIEQICLANQTSNVNERPIVNIGISGIVLPLKKSDFPPEFQTFSRLGYYSILFNSLEINSSFYKTPLPNTFFKWTQETSDNFTFTVKLSKAITHSRDLDFDPNDIKQFMLSANRLADKKGALLVQFPASITDNYFEKVSLILEHIQNANSDNGWRVAVELRHSDWYNANTYQMLKQHQASLVFHDMPNSRTPLEQQATDIIYLRLHGPAGDYKGSYSDQEIAAYGKWLNKKRDDGKTIYVYFNNTIGSAYDNARLLQAHLD